MESRYSPMNYPSPRGVHVPETYASPDVHDPYRRDSASTTGRRNRYSRSVSQTPRLRDVTWVSSPDPTPQTPYAPPTPWLPPPQLLQEAPSTPAYRPSSVGPPSPAPTVGEHMAVDDVDFPQDGFMDPYAYEPLGRGQSGGGGLIKSFWKGLKKLSGFRSQPHLPFPRPSSYVSQVPPGVNVPSEGTLYGNPTPVTGTDEQRGGTPYTSPYVRPTSLGATPAVIPGSLRRSPVPIPSIDVPPPITIVSPSIPPSPLPNSIRSARMPTPAMNASQRLSVGVRMPTPEPPAEESSQTLHEHDPNVPRPSFGPSISRPPTVEPKFPTAPSLDTPSRSRNSSTMARFRRFVSGLDDLPWVSDNQIANEYVPDMNPRSQVRKNMRKGAEPSWYNPRAEVMEQPGYWSEWDMWAKQSTAGLWVGSNEDRGVTAWDGLGAPGPWGVMRPHGYVPAQPGFVYPSGYPPPGVMRQS